jgi:hypothetical protein
VNPLRRHPTCQETAALGGQRPPSSVKVPAASNLLDHPGTVYLREADLLPHLDGWLTGLFDPPTAMPPSTRAVPVRPLRPPPLM